MGNFTPSVLKTSAFEVALKKHRQGEFWPPHYQQVATEYNLVVYGQLAMKNEREERHFGAGDIFVISPQEIWQPRFITDCEVVCVKVPSLPGDKVVCDS